MRKLLLFDIDGTLLDTSGAGRRAVHAALREHLALAADPADVRFDGKTDPQIIRELFLAAGRAAADERAVRAIAERYVVLLARELAGGVGRVRPLAGVTPLLDAVEARTDVVLGLLTGNVRDGARLKLTAAGIAFDRFRVGAFGSDHADRAMLPPIAAERAHAVMGRRPHGAEVVIVGDTPADIVCGRGIGARAVGVATGRYSAAQLRRAGAWAVFESLAETATVLDALLAA